MADSERSASPAASPSAEGRRPAPPPRRAVSAKLTPVNSIIHAKPSSFDDNSAPAASPSGVARPRLPGGSSGISSPTTPSTPPATSSNAAVVPLDSAPRTFTPPPDSIAASSSTPSSPVTTRLQNRHSMMNMMKEVRKINTAPTPPVGHTRPLELPIPKPPPSNVPKSVADDDLPDKIAALAAHHRVKEDEVEAARRIFQKLDLNGDGLISFNDFVRFKFDPLNKDVHSRVANFFGGYNSPPSPSSSAPGVTRSISAFVSPVSRSAADPTELPVRKAEPPGPSVETPPRASTKLPPGGIQLPVASPPNSLHSSSGTSSTSSSTTPTPTNSTPASPRLAAPASPRGPSYSQGTNTSAMSPRRPAALSSGGGAIPKGPPTPSPAPTAGSGPPTPTMSRALPPPGPSPLGVSYSHGGPPLPSSGPPMPSGLPQNHGPAAPAALLSGPPVPQSPPPASQQNGNGTPTGQSAAQNGPPRPSPSSNGPPMPTGISTAYGPPRPTGGGPPPTPQPPPVASSSPTSPRRAPSNAVPQIPAATSGPGPTSTQPAASAPLTSAAPASTPTPNSSAPAPGAHLSGIASALEGMELPETPREDEEESNGESAPSDAAKNGLSFRNVDWEKVNATPEESDANDNKLEDWDKPRDDPDDIPEAGGAAEPEPAPAKASDPGMTKKEKRNSAQRMLSGARSKSSKMLSGLVNKLNGKPSGGK